MQQDASKRSWFFSSESVTEGHPDKICDQISDAVLDRILTEDPSARVACECIVTTGFVFVTGEISTKSYVDIPNTVRSVIREIGYTGSDLGFDAETCAVLTSINEQSVDIAQGVDHALESRVDSVEDKSLETGAGDQGMMFGYACRETESYMPLPIELAHQLCKRLAQLRREGILPLLRPDGKAQVTVAYEGNRPVAVKTVVVSTQHEATYDQEQLREDLIRDLIRPVIPSELLTEETAILINPTGRFVIGGPMGDSGLTGRKIIVDTYGGMAAHGGGAFSGKDPTKVDRSASYAARYIAKNLVAAGVADRLQVQLAYSIGVARPVSISVETYGSSDYSNQEIIEMIQKVFPLTPQAIIEQLNLRRPIYRQTATYGHFGRTDLDLPWERLDRVEAVRALMS